ncbi:MAG: SCP2 sterol-binding domain-containing protein [Acidimicrobiia bacterium]
MAVEFLTEEWAQAVDGAMAQSEGFQDAISSTTMSAQFVVAGVPDRGDVTYNLVIAAGSAAMSIGPKDDADVTVNQTYETAVKVSRGETSTQQAFMMGQIKVSGNMAVLMMNQAALTQYAAAVSGLEIDYP